MAGQGFQDREAKVIRYHASVPENIRADYQRIFSEMPRDLYEAAVNHYGKRGGSINIAEKIRLLNPSYKPFYMGYTSVNPPRSDVQFTERHDSKDVRPYDDLKRNLYHEIGHVVYSDFAAQAAGTGRNFRAEFAKAYSDELTKLGYPQTKPVADYFLPSPLDADNSKSKEAFCEMLSHDANGGIHSFNRPDGTPIDVARDFPKSLALMREARDAYIKTHDPNVPEPTALEQHQKALGPDWECKDMGGGSSACEPKPGTKADEMFKRAYEGHKKLSTPPQ